MQSSQARPSMSFSRQARRPARPAAQEATPALVVRARGMMSVVHCECVTFRMGGLVHCDLILCTFLHCSQSPHVVQSHVTRSL
jgi:hypothetical protein